MRPAPTQARWLACVSVLLAAAPRAEAQTASVQLRVLQQAGAPVPDAEVTAHDGRAERVARTDSAGTMRVEGLAPGRVELRVRRVGFAPARVFVRAGEGENRFTVHLDGSVAVLDEVRVVGSRPVSGRLEDFEMRLRRREASAVLTRDQIDKRNPIRLSQMLRGMAGIRIADSMGVTVAISTRGNVANKGKPVPCVLRLSVDGIVLPALSDIDGVVPRDVHGVEVFYGPSRVPPQYGGLRTDAWCGLVAIWTRVD